MSSVEKRTRNGAARWYARWRDPAGRPRSKTFARKVDAEQFLVSVSHDMLTGRYVSQADQRRTFRVLAEQHWSATSHMLAEDTTRIVKRSRLDRHILPVLGDYPLGSIRPSTVTAAVATWSATLAPGTVGQVLRQVRQILDVALADGLIGANPAKGRTVKPPTPPRRRDVHLTDEDVAALVGAAAPVQQTDCDYRPLVLVLAGLGLRVSEACGLRVGDVDFLRRVVRVRAQRRPGGELGALKTPTSSRDIPAPDAVLTALAEQIRRSPRADGRVFSSVSGRALTKAIAGHVFDGLGRAAGVSVSPHSLRHYFGASLISRGVSVVAVSHWMGHSSPEITWRVYAYLMPSDEGTGRAAMASVMTALDPGVYPLCTGEGVE